MARPSSSRHDSGSTSSQWRGALCCLRLRPDRLVERIACRANGADGIARTLDVHGLAQPADMHVNRARLDIDVRAPHRIQELLAAEHPARMLDEVIEQLVLRRPQMHFP